MTQLPLQLSSRQAWSVAKVSFSSCPFIRKVLTLIKVPVLRKKVDHHNCISAQRVDTSLNWRSAETTGKRLDFHLLLNTWYYLNNSSRKPESRKTLVLCTAPWTKSYDVRYLSLLCKVISQVVDLARSQGIVCGWFDIAYNYKMVHCRAVQLLNFQLTFS